MSSLNLTVAGPPIIGQGSLKIGPGETGYVFTYNGPATTFSFTNRDANTPDHIMIQGAPPSIVWPPDHSSIDNAHTVPGGDTVSVAPANYMGAQVQVFNNPGGPDLYLEVDI